MEQQYREMFDEVRSSSRLQEEVRKMSEMERKPAGRRFPRKILMVAAVLAVLAGTAVAAVGAPGTLRGWFAQEWEETEAAGNPYDLPVLAEAGGYVFYAAGPTDLPVDESIPGALERYTQLSAQISKLLESFTLPA